MSNFRRCSRPGCGKPAVATLTYAYAESTAVIGPLAPAAEPHCWDLCEEHAEKITPPMGWNLVRVADIEPDDDDDDLTALAKAVREAGSSSSGLVVDEPTHNHPIHRGRRKEAEKGRRRAHLYVVDGDS